MKKKKLAGVFLSLSLVAGALAGCSGDSKTSSSGGVHQNLVTQLKLGPTLNCLEVRHHSANRLQMV